MASRGGKDKGKSRVIDTGKVTGRRQVRFATIPDLAVEIDRVVAADKSGRLGRVGNWTSGQQMGHLAKWIEMSYEGYPFQLSGWTRFMAGLAKGRTLREGMKPGYHLPKRAMEKIGDYPDVPVDQAGLRLKRALARLKAGEIPTHANPFFGKLRLEEWVELHLRHAELHMSFLHP
jgi:hypothetical protein